MATTAASTTVQLRSRHWWRRTPPVPDPTTLLLHRETADARHRASLLREIDHPAAKPALLRALVEALDGPNG